MKISINLTEEEVAKVKVLAAKANVDDYKAFIDMEFHTKVLQMKVGQPQISAHSSAKGGRVTGASNGNAY